MEKMVLAGIFALAASTTFAQTGPATSPATDPAGAGGPANLCQELLAFMEAPPPEVAEAPPAPTQAAEEDPAEGGDAVESDETAAAEGEESAPASGQTVEAQTSAESSSSQDLSGQSGPATESPDEEPAPAPAEEGTAQNAPQRANLSAPVSNDPTSTPKDSVLSVDEARQLADAGDIAACQAAARELRIAGVAVPPPFLALMALDLEYHPTANEP